LPRRLLQEAMVLRLSVGSVFEIAYSLGFKRVTHFNNFFKKHTETSPLKFRKV
jgi:AraC family transcriptional regulator, transcriptional activator of pobA